MAICHGTRRDGTPCTARVRPGEQWCYHHDPDFAEERRRNASRAAAIGNSKIGGEIRGVRLMIRDLVEATFSGELDVRVKKRLAEIVGLLQVYSRLAELEVAAGEVPKFPGKGYVALPGDTAEKAKEWAEKEGERARIMEGIAEFNRDPMGTLKAMQ
jgi:hypothetical protein